MIASAMHEDRALTRAGWGATRAGMAWRARARHNYQAAWAEHLLKRVGSVATIGHRRRRLSRLAAHTATFDA